MSVKFFHLNIANVTVLYNYLYKMLPAQGCIEFQRDAPDKKHTWHCHENSETLLIIEGALAFYYDDKCAVCRPGDVIHLPSMIRHQSIASDAGCVYGIAKQIITF